VDDTRTPIRRDEALLIQGSEWPGWTTTKQPTITHTRGSRSAGTKGEDRCCYYERGTGQSQRSSGRSPARLLSLGWWRHLLVLRRRPVSPGAVWWCPTRRVVQTKSGCRGSTKDWRRTRSSAPTRIDRAGATGTDVKIPVALSRSSAPETRSTGDPKTCYQRRVSGDPLLIEVTREFARGRRTHATLSRPVADWRLGQ
jgi:hypothetical protein